MFVIDIIDHPPLAFIHSSSCKNFDGCAKNAIAYQLPRRRPHFFRSSNHKLPSNIPSERNTGGDREVVASRAHDIRLQSGLPPVQK
jgi:hypothetical protein